MQSIVRSVCGVFEISIAEVTMYVRPLVSEEAGSTQLTLGSQIVTLFCELILQLAILEDHEKMCNIIDARLKSDCSG